MTSRFAFAVLGSAALALAAPATSLAGVRAHSSANSATAKAAASVEQNAKPKAAAQEPAQEDEAKSAPPDKAAQHEKAKSAHQDKKSKAARDDKAKVAAQDEKAKPAAQDDQPKAAEQDTRSEAARRVIDWVASSHDNGSLPYVVIDKQAAALYLFNGKGEALGAAPVLIGVGVGDTSTPGVGSKSLAKIGPAERTTPAGRFLAKFGFAAGGEKVLWVDYADSVAMHAVITTNKKERRVHRLRTPTADDNRITFGCINVPTSFYQKRVRPLFQKKGGIVYVLPDTKSLEEVFPRLLAQPFHEAKAD
jgi:hypothetical protein